MPIVESMVVQNCYRPVRLLGANGTRQTWLAAEEKTGQTVTLKALYFGEGALWQDFKLFEREAETLQSLSHSRIPRQRDAFWWEQPEGNYFCLIQDFIPGQSLEASVRNLGPLPEAEVRTIAAEVLEILIYLHRQSPPVIHRDLTPANLIWGEDGRIYLIDFGAVQAVSAPEKTMTVVGTYRLYAPGAVRGPHGPCVRSVRPRGDAAFFAHRDQSWGTAPRELSDPPGGEGERRSEALAGANARSRFAVPFCECLRRPRSTRSAGKSACADSERSTNRQLHCPEANCRTTHHRG
ncbi:serine/threonine protein kinase [Gloeobacter violaceus]|uniref:Glr4017 protein n=1 Tax=Gloeobacter violaceus (strain ATCC 29082 / PCC 7421) TaxID=251221 RepID=Q7NE63_GLOVI|nr:protein kinase [Gloeobacter violaceus]BAC91958.1 glr4017 [Gloeobacter violaceus PCC 7421]